MDTAGSQGAFAWGLMECYARATVAATRSSITEPYGYRVTSGHDGHYGNDLGVSRQSVPHPESFSGKLPLDYA